LRVAVKLEELKVICYIVGVEGQKNGGSCSPVDGEKRDYAEEVFFHRDIVFFGGLYFFFRAF